MLINLVLKGYNLICLFIHKLIFRISFRIWLYGLLEYTEYTECSKKLQNFISVVDNYEIKA